MKTYEVIVTIINILAVLVSPIIAVFIGQKLQDRAIKRKDKMQIFQCLMTRRKTGWAAWEAVNALNAIDIVFSDSDAVCDQWKQLMSKFRRDIPYQDQYREQCKLLELMANDLGYKNKITWEVIQNPYYPEGLDKQIEINEQIMDGQAGLAKAVGIINNMMNSPKSELESTDNKATDSDN